MAEEKKKEGIKSTEKAPVSDKKPADKKQSGDKSGDNGERRQRRDRDSDSKDRGRGRKPRNRREEREPREFDQQILDIARVTRVTKGGKRMRFRITMVIGDRKGRVGYGIAKGIDVQSSVQKAVNQAKKNMIEVPMQNETIPHAVEVKFASARVLLKPAPKGTGVKAGGSVRTVLEFAGVPNVVGKIMGSPSKINNTKATLKGLASLMPALKPSKKEKGEVKKDDKNEPVKA